MFELGWENTELENLNENGRKLLVDVRSLLTKYDAPTPDDFVDKDLLNYFALISHSLLRMSLFTKESLQYIFLCL